MNKISRNLSILSAFFLLFACSSPIGPSAEADIIGVITNINSNSSQLGILVEEDPAITDPEKKNGNKIVFYISKKTKIYQQVHSKLTEIKSSDLKVNMNVKVWAGNVFLESYPAQTDAVKIIVLAK